MFFDYSTYPVWLIIGGVLVIRYMYRFFVHGGVAKKSTKYAEYLLGATDSKIPWGGIKHGVSIGSIVLFALLLSQPIKTNVSSKSTQTGLDIVLVLDVSKSMLADDFEPNRLEVAKQVIGDFLKELERDRVGLVIFAGKPFTRIPMTTDYEFIQETISGISTDTINQEIRSLQGTATGEGLLSALTLLEQSGSMDAEDESEKIIILLTDGEVTLGTLNPLVASQLAKKKNTKVYTVGIGSQEGGSLIYEGVLGTQRIEVPGVDEETLQEIAAKTDGAYRRAKDKESFEEIFDEIASLSKTEKEITSLQEKQLYRKPLVFLLLFFLFLLYRMREQEE